MKIRYIEQALEDQIRLATNGKAARITEGVLEIMRDPANPDVVLKVIRGVEIEIPDTSPLTPTEQGDLDALFTDRAKGKR